MKLLQEEATNLKSQEFELLKQLTDVGPALIDILRLVPQPADAEVPIGADDTQNVEIRKWSAVRTFDFTPKDHVTLGQELGILDLERGVKLSGSRSYFLVGAGAMLHQAVLRLALDMMIQRGFVPMTVPVIVREPAMLGTGYFPLGREQSYAMRDEDPPIFLVGTAEVSLTACHMGEILDESALPLLTVAMSPCFRREAGTAGTGYCRTLPHPSVR